MLDQEKFFNTYKVQEAFDRSMTIATPKSSMSYFLQGLLAQREQHGLHMEETAGKDWEALAHWYLENKDWAEPIYHLIDASYTVSYTHLTLPTT